jgi:hypothetical protein
MCDSERNSLAMNSMGRKKLVLFNEAWGPGTAQAQGSIQVRFTWAVVAFGQRPVEIGQHRCFSATAFPRWNFGDAT